MDQNIQKILEIKNKKMQKAFNQNHIELLFLDNKHVASHVEAILGDLVREAWLQSHTVV